MTALRNDIVVRVVDEGVELTDSLTQLTVGLPVSAESLKHAPASTTLEPWTTLVALGFLEQGLSAYDIRSRQRHYLRREFKAQLPARRVDLLTFITVHVPYYRDRAATYAPSAAENDATFSRLPLMTKADLRAHFPHGLVSDTVDVPALLESGEVELAATSGTTGERLQVFSDMAQGSVPDVYEALWNLPPSDDVPRTAVFTTPTCLGNQCHLGHAPYADRLRGEGNTLFLNSVDDLFSELKADVVRRIVDEMHAFGPHFMLVNPFYAHWLGRQAQALKLRLPTPQLMLSCYQYLSTLQRRALQALWGAPVYSYYFATDLSGCRLGIECMNGHLHVREDHVCLEVVGPEGPKPQGALGTLAFTALSNRVAPLVRYVVGDIGRSVEVDCDCAVNAWSTLELHGRAKDVLVRKDTHVTTRQFDDVVAQRSGIDFYKATQHSLERVDIEVVPSPDAAFHSAPLIAAVREAFGFGEVRIKEVRRLDPEASSKFRLTSPGSLKVPELL